MLDHDALWGSGGARGVDDVGEMAGGQAEGARVGVAGGQFGPGRGGHIQIDHAQIGERLGAERGAAGGIAKQQRGAASSSTCRSR
ncbi:hypothetical protein M728_005321 (plasmid) [Ensifer sp. WSM1721]